MFNPRNINSDKGITLTILVITIVVILILSGVTITAVMGDQGLINKSEELSNNTNETNNIPSKKGRFNASQLLAAFDKDINREFNLQQREIHKTE